MPYLTEYDFERWRAADEQIRTLERERNELRDTVKQSSILVAGAMRQGYANDVQREALLYAFCRLTGEKDEKIALLMVDVPPKGFMSAIVAKPDLYERIDKWRRDFLTRHKNGDLQYYADAASGLAIALQVIDRKRYDRSTMPPKQ